MGSAVAAEPKSKSKAEVSAEHAEPAPSAFETEAAYGAPAGMPLFLGLSLQRKLAVGAVDDPLEREADQVAEQVMRMPDPAATPSTTPGEIVQRKCTPCPDEQEQQTFRRKCHSSPEEEKQHRASQADISRKPSSGAKSLDGTTVPANVHQVLGSAGRPLDSATRAFYEPRFGRSFEHVRIHTDPAAAASARDVHALAYTQGRDIVFASGQFQPDAERGRRLLAHELTHVVQQGSAEPERIQRSYLEPSPEQGVSWEVPTPPIKIVGQTDETTTIRRAPGPDEPATSAPEPKLIFTPGDTLTRGDTLTARVDFTPTAGEKLTVTGWEYTTANGDTVTRPSRDTGFQRQWQGVMALSGNMQLSYTVKPKRGAAGPAATATSAVTVNDRTGPDWKTTITDAPETPLTGAPSPPEEPHQLGIHITPADYEPAANHSKIPNGPNAQFEYVTLMQDRNYKSEPHIHPDVTNPDSVFRRFHLDRGRLYFVPGGDLSRRILIPLAEYRVVSSTGDRMVFTVTDWTAFYKRHNVLTVTCSAQGRTVTANNDWWNLDLRHMVNGLPDSNINFAADGARAARAALGVGSGDAVSIQVTPNGGWEQISLMPSAKILPGTQSHEYQHPRHSHRANLHAIVEALDPRRVLESLVSTPSRPVVFGDRIHALILEIQRPEHELVDKAASQSAGHFVPIAGATMAAVNVDPNTGAHLGAVWDITHDHAM